MNDKKLWPVFSTFIRLRDSDPNGFCSCITCGAIRYYKDMDCGHGIGRQHWGTRYDERNNGSQCSRCNSFGQGEQAKYKDAVNKKYGKGTWDTLVFLSRMPVKWGQFEIDMMTVAYKQKVAELKAMKNLKETG